MNFTARPPTRCAEREHANYSLHKPLVYIDYPN